MEIYALICGITESLKIIEKLAWLEQKYLPKAIVIYSDSQYAVNCANGSFKRKANLDMWESFDRIREGFEILSYKFSFEYVKAKSTPETKLVDKLAKSTWS